MILNQGISVEMYRNVFNLKISVHQTLVALVLMVKTIFEDSVRNLSALLLCFLL